MVGTTRAAISMSVSLRIIMFSFLRFRHFLELRGQRFGNFHRADAAALRFRIIPSDATAAEAVTADADALFRLLGNLQHTEYRIGVIVAAVSAVVDAILAADMRPSLQ